MIDDAPRKCAADEWPGHTDPVTKAYYEPTPCPELSMGESIGGRCAGCHKRFCIYHLNPPDHDCKKARQ